MPGFSVKDLSNYLNREVKVDSMDSIISWNFVLETSGTLETFSLPSFAMENKTIAEIN